jgi:hypothetical protein
MPPSGQDSPDGQPKGDGSPPPPPGDEKDLAKYAKKRIQDAQYRMKKAEEAMKKKDMEGAAPEQKQAEDDLAAARKKLEQLLQQLREEEYERLLMALIMRCQKMHDMQVDVWNATQAVYRTVQGRADKQPAREDTYKTLTLAYKERKIIQEAQDAIKLLEAEGSATAFAEIFQQVKSDMQHIERRLGNDNPGLQTQSIEQDVIEMLKEMIKALEKAKQDMDEEKDKKKQKQDQKAQKPQDKDLLKLLEELKILRYMQYTVNKRTEKWSRDYPGEQAADPNIVRELADLARRQERLVEVTSNLARGRNK